MDYDKCHRCNSKNHEKRNIKTVKDDNEETEVSFNLYCMDCGNYIASFEWGHWEY